METFGTVLLQVDEKFLTLRLISAYRNTGVALPIITNNG